MANVNFYFTTFRDGHLVTGRTNLILQGTTNTTLGTTMPTTGAPNNPAGSWYFATATVGSIINENGTTTTTTVAGPAQSYPERYFNPSTVFWEGSGDIGETPVEWFETTFRGRDFPNPYNTAQPIIYESAAFTISNGKGVSSLYTEVWTNSGSAFSYQDYLAAGAIVFIAFSTDGTTFSGWYRLGRTGKFRTSGNPTTVNGAYYFPTQNVPNSANASHFKLKVRADRGFDTHLYANSTFPFGIYINKTYKDGVPLEVYPSATQIPE